jgi:glutamate-1-semialdehyde aminotransferase
VEHCSTCRNYELSCAIRCYQAGLSGNPLAMAAGLAMLKTLDADRDVFIRLKIKQLI